MIQIQKLIFDLSINDKAEALDVQSRISMFADTTASCLENVLEKHNRPDKVLTLDCLELDLGNLDYQLMEEELLQKIQKAVQEKLNELYHEETLYQNRHDFSDTLKLDHENGHIFKSENTAVDTLVLPSNRLYSNEFTGRRGEVPLSRGTIGNIISEIERDRNSSFNGIKLESDYEHALRAVIYFLKTGLPYSNTGGAAPDKNRIKKILSETPSLQEWLIGEFSTDTALLQRLLYHFTDSEICQISHCGFSEEICAELIHIIEESCTVRSDRKRLLFWRILSGLLKNPVDRVSVAVILKAFWENTEYKINSFSPITLSSELSEFLKEESELIAEGELLVLTESGKIKITASDISHTSFEIKYLPLSLSEGAGSASSDKKSGVKRGVSHGDESSADDSDHERDDLHESAGNSVHSSENNSLNAVIYSANKKWDSEESFQAELEPVSGDTYYINNGGLLITAPFLIYLFRGIGYIENDEFISPQHQKQAAVLLHSLSGDDMISEDQMILSKILCGLPLTEPVPLFYKPSEEESGELHTMIESLISYWPILKNTSVEAFKHNYMKREAVLTLKDNNWDLKVKRESIDVIIDTLPWPVSIIKLPWMKKSVITEW